MAPKPAGEGPAEEGAAPCQEEGEEETPEVDPEVDDEQPDEMPVVVEEDEAPAILQEGLDEKRRRWWKNKMGTRRTRTD